MSAEAHTTQSKLKVGASYDVHPLLFTISSGPRQQEVEGLVNRAGQVAEVVEGRARGRSWGKHSSWAIPTGPVPNTRSVLGTSSQHIFVQVCC